MDSTLAHTLAEELLEHFVTACLGLTLAGRIRDPSLLPPRHRCYLTDRDGNSRPWAAWRTDRGIVTAYADYDHVQARWMGAHVVHLSWWIGSDVHHEGWWHCYPRRPREWIKGRGTQTTEPPRS